MHPSPLDGITFSATVDATFRKAVESLFFFNPRQSDYIDEIRQTIALCGLPAIVERDGRIWLDVSSGGCQCLFAIQEASREPIAIALFDRPEASTLRITHLAVAYPHSDDRGAASLSERVVFKVLEVGQAIRGIKRVQLPYRRTCYLPVTVNSPHPGAVNQRSETPLHS